MQYFRLIAIARELRSVLTYEYPYTIAIENLGNNLDSSISGVCDSRIQAWLALRSSLVSGFVYTNLDEGEKVVQVDLIGVGRATAARPRNNLTGDPHYTDGLRAVLVIDRWPRPLTEIQSFEWERPRAVRFLDILNTNQD